MAASVKGINAYSSPAPDGGVTVDVEAMAVDLITVMKASGAKKDSFMHRLGQMFEEIQVSVRIPNRAKN